MSGDSEQDGNVVTIFGPTYEMRNHKFQMDREMYMLLCWYRLQGKGPQAFEEGLRAERIIRMGVSK